MELYRIGDKVVDGKKIQREVQRILSLRAQGYSQLEVSQRLGIDRPWISRLESMGEVRKGKKLALVGFPVANKEELARVAAQEGVDFVFLLTDRERWAWVEEKSGAQLVNQMMEIISKLGQKYDLVVFLGSDMRLKILEAIMGQKLVGVEIGKSPIKEDCYVEPEKIRKLIAQCKGEDN
ncbi:MAG TPA: transcriptional regulator [Bacillota bacterium]|nr:transcriptional regulator [Bacillota bacterium]